MSAKENNMTLPTIGVRESRTNPKQVSNNAKLEKDVIIIETFDDQVAIFFKLIRKIQKQVTNNANLKKEVIIIDSSNDEVDLVVTKKSYSFKKEFIFVNKNDVSIMPCDDENTLPNIEDLSSGFLFINY
ncbi:hypothetical protein Tco_1323673 [Tanacetum coccineum]